MIITPDNFNLEDYIKNVSIRKMDMTHNNKAVEDIFKYIPTIGDLDYFTFEFCSILNITRDELFTPMPYTRTGESYKTKKKSHIRMCKSLYCAFVKVNLNLTFKQIGGLFGITREGAYHLYKVGAAYIYSISYNPIHNERFKRILTIFINYYVNPNNQRTNPTIRM